MSIAILSELHRKDLLQSTLRTPQDAHGTLQHAGF
jgi:hypothetical protein